MTIRYFTLPPTEAAHSLLALPTPYRRWQPRYLLPYRETAPTPYGQVWRQGTGDSLRCCETCPDSSSSPGSSSSPNSPSSLDSSGRPDTWYGQVLRQGAGDGLRCCETCPNVPTNPTPDSLNDSTNPAPNDEYIRHILIGSPQGVQETIYLLQARHYVDHAQWSGPLKASPSLRESHRRRRHQNYPPRGAGDGLPNATAIRATPSLCDRWTFLGGSGGDRCGRLL